MTTLTKITATYTVCSDFYLPPWMKKEDIKEYWVRYNVLHVEMKTGKTYSIQPYCSATDADFKYPDFKMDDGELTQELDEDTEDVDDDEVEEYCPGIEEDDD